MQNGDTFVPFYGGFFASPVPLELSFNWCSHNCHYCFANLSKPNRRSDIGATVNLLQNYRSRSTLEAKLLQQGYPTLVSNRVDPFAASNYRQSLPVLEMMCELGLPLSFQTKGGRGINETLDILKAPTVWYITIETDQNELAKQIAPGAPSIDERFELIDLLISRGHFVCVGINPCVPEWFNDDRAFLQRLYDAGVWGVWCQELHFNTNQLRNMPPRGKDAIGPELIKRCSKKKVELVDYHYADQMAEWAQEIGLEPFVDGQCRRSNYWDVFFACYEKTFPTQQEFINWCHDELKTGDTITFSDYLAFWEGELPEGIMQLGHYICSQNYSLCKALAQESGRKWDHKMTYADLLGLSFGDTRIPFSPGSTLGFRYAVTPQGETWVDEAGQPILVWMGGESSTELTTVVEDL
ncbi:radical SAM protein [Nodosilinea sp. FACHB-131]|uniref:radical SAM protein n=1 Tax=Cyanophyceae TaxID=3028117 RepID=UPI00168881F3|nr:radical SAM protein [Nodosilinea sp. FACHB-131]MBD1871923.1 radical SAM protein [Nodosilinea sp. FACHB-131]